MHQLAAHASRTCGPGRESTPDHGLVVVGVHTPEFGFERDLDNVRRAVAELGVAYPVAVDRRLRDLAGVRQPLLAGAVLRRRAGPDPAPPLRRGRVRAVRDGRSSSCSRGGHSHGRRSSSWSSRAVSRCPPTGRPGLAGDVPRLRARRGLRVPGGAAPGEPQSYTMPVAAGAQPVGAVGRVDDRGAAGAARRRRRADRLPVPRPRREPRDGAGARGTSVPFRVLVDGQPPAPRTGRRRRGRATGR